MKTFDELLRQQFPKEYILCQEMEYNLGINIEEYFDQEVVMIAGGYGGTGFDVRFLQGYFNQKKEFLYITTPEYLGSLQEIYYPASYKVRCSEWPYVILLPDRIKNFKDKIKLFLSNIEDENSRAYCKLLEMKNMFRCIRIGEKNEI